MTHVTARAGLGQTLVRTKDRRTINARLKEYQSEIAVIRKLVNLTPQAAAAGGLHKRIEVAIKASTVETIDLHIGRGLCVVSVVTSAGKLAFSPRPLPATLISCPAEQPGCERLQTLQQIV